MWEYQQQSEIETLGVGNDNVYLQNDRSSVAENQQTRASLEQQLREEKEAEIAQLQEQMRQLATEKEREMAELRRQLEISQRTSAKRVSKPEASVLYNIVCYNQTISLICETCESMTAMSCYHDNTLVI